MNVSWEITRMCKPQNPSVISQYSFGRGIVDCKQQANTWPNADQDHHTASTGHNTSIPLKNRRVCMKILVFIIQVVLKFVSDFCSSGLGHWRMWAWFGLDELNLLQDACTLIPSDRSVPGSHQFAIYPCPTWKPHEHIPMCYCWKRYRK